MARDPFAPVVESGIPKWVWLLVGGFAFLLVGLGVTVALVLTKRPTVQTAKAGTLPPSSPTVAAPDKPAGEVAANDKPSATADDKGDKGDKSDEPHKKKHHGGGGGGGGGSKKPASDKPADKPATPAKPKKVMEQKDIDKLLGL